MNMMYEIVRPTHNSETNSEANEIVTPMVNSETKWIPTSASVCNGTQMKPSKFISPYAFSFHHIFGSSKFVTPPGHVSDLVDVTWLVDTTTCLQPTRTQCYHAYYQHELLWQKHTNSSNGTSSADNNLHGNSNAMRITAYHGDSSTGTSSTDNNTYGNDSNMSTTCDALM